MRGPVHRVVLGLRLPRPPGPPPHAFSSSLGFADTSGVSMIQVLLKKVLRFLHRERDVFVFSCGWFFLVFIIFSFKKAGRMIPVACPQAASDPGRT